jgi:acylphosphatase
LDAIEEVMRYRIVVLGDVQQVGFREYVKKCAQQLQAKGSVKNLDDGSVEIYCAIEESALDKFKELIGKPPMGEVEEIKVYPEGSSEYGTPETNFSKFKVIRDEDEVAETLSVMARAGFQMLEKQDKMIELQNLTIEKIDAMHKDMNERFDRMEVKYGAISEAIKVFLEEFRTFNAKLDEHNRKLDLILEKLIEMEGR